MSGRPKLLIEEPRTTPDGRTIVLLTNKLPLRSSKGEIVGVLGTYMDITERRRNEEALANLQKLESLGTLAGGIAHDFNNILTAIAGNISLLQADRPGEAETRELLSEAQDACETAKGLSNQLLTFAKGGAPVAAVMDLRPVIEKSAAFASRGSNARCAYALGDGPLAVKIDPSQIAQVVQNLVLNAVQAMPGGGEIELRAGSVDVRDGDDPRLAAGRYARVTVRDHGSGIEPRDLPRVFEPYFSTKAAGRGLGLSMCHSIMRRHGGDIRVESVPGRGTSFILHLPEAPPDAAPARTRAEEPRAGEGRVLVMDDEPTVARTLLRTLKSLGYRGDWVADGEAALNAYEQALKDSEPYAAVLMDLTIPGALGGKETAAQLKALHPEATAVVMSGYSNDPVLADHAAYGFAAALLKPFDRESVSAAMTAARVVRG
jgi:signal transduction histidine kinase/ActR/RegA family two-component response regulator